LDRSITPLKFGMMIVAAAVVTTALPAQAQTAMTRSTFSGVYSEKQATAGKNIYGESCQGCHTEASHTGPVFQGSWIGKSLWDLFHYVRTEMPKTEPGSLTEEQYGQVVAYLLKLNAMPAGEADMPTDSVALHTIRFDTVAAPAARKPNR
jgi:S-disulfanyl-L-cysteine oxidoreductase SoxD